VTDEIFRRDAYVRSIEARVVAADQTGIELDRTVFYPEGGGQPGDRGILRCGALAIPIVDTRKDERGRLLHLPAAGAALPQPEAEVTATINWDYRYRHMRMHTCLHLLCALVPRGVTGGAIGQNKGRLDFALPDVPDKACLEEQLQRLIAGDYAVSYRFISDAELAAASALVRTLSVQPPRGQGQVRLVDVAGVDLQPCGGTHVARTREIGRVRVGKIESKGKQNRRINIHLE
jgi:misacylated tRNA(Ala) deacylase